MEKEKCSASKKALLRSITNRLVTVYQQWGIINILLVLTLIPVFLLPTAAAGPLYSRHLDTTLTSLRPQMDCQFLCQTLADSSSFTSFDSCLNVCCSHRSSVHMEGLLGVSSLLKKIFQLNGRKLEWPVVGYSDVCNQYAVTVQYKHSEDDMKLLLPRSQKRRWGNKVVPCINTHCGAYKGSTRMRCIMTKCSKLN